MFHPQNEAGTSGRDPLFLTYEIKDLTVSKSIFSIQDLSDLDHYRQISGFDKFIPSGVNIKGYLETLL